MGYCAEGADEKQFKECFDRTISRGPDATRIVDTGNGLLGFHRLAIMGLSPEGMQPFELHGNYCVCNGEIYGFEKIKESLSSEYEFVSGSDCEILLPMYEKYGTDMFRMLDAEFACIIYDVNKRDYVAARDPIGIRPLFYGYDAKGAIVFASEAINLVGLVKEIIPFPPAHFYAEGQFIRYSNVAKPDKKCYDSIEKICENIRTKLTAGIEKRLVADAKVGFLLFQLTNKNKNQVKTRRKIAAAPES